MRKSIILSVIFIGFIVSCSDDNGINEDPIGETNDNGQVSNQVTMSASAFQPVTLTITPGTTVLWINTSSMAHTVTSSTNLFDEHLDPDEEFSYTFNTAGSFEYVCTLHPGMNGTIVVEQ